MFPSDSSPITFVSSIGVNIPAASYAFESAPDDSSIIRKMGGKLGYVRTGLDSQWEYWAYDDFDFSDGATHLTVRATSATQGGTLSVRLANHYNPELTIATVDIPNTGGWNSFRDFTVNVDRDDLAKLGTNQDLFFVVENNGDSDYLFDSESFRFNKNRVGDQVQPFVYKNAPGVVSSEHYKFQKYFKELSGWSNTYINFEIAEFGSPVEVKI